VRHDSFVMAVVNDYSIPSTAGSASCQVVFVSPSRQSETRSVRGSLLGGIVDSDGVGLKCSPGVDDPAIAFF